MQFRSPASIAAMVSLSSVGALAAHAGVTSTPPPVVWEVKARLWQHGWNGLSDPNHVWVDGLFVKTISNGSGGFAVNTTNDSWGFLWNWNGSFPTLGVSSGYLGTNQVSCGRFLTSDWSSNFIIETAEASLEVTGWVRGGPGTEYVSEVSHSGLWAGTVQDSGKVAISGFGTTVQSCVNCAVALPFLVSSTTKPHVAAGPSVVFDEYPGVVYTRVDFVAPDSAYSLSTDVSALVHIGSESCVIFCGAPSQVKGSGSLVSSFRVFLPFGDPPQFETPPAKVVTAQIGKPVNLSVVAVDPDNLAGSGIQDHVWRIDGEVVQFGENAGTLTWAPSTSGSFACSVEVADDEGMWAIAECTISVGLPGDLDGDGKVSGADLTILLGTWGPCPASDGCAADLDASGAVDAVDLAMLLAAWS